MKKRIFDTSLSQQWLETVIGNGMTIAKIAHDWAVNSYWGKQGRELEDTISCLESDAFEGHQNGAKSLAQAKLFLSAMKKMVEAGMRDETADEESARVAKNPQKAKEAAKNPQKAKEADFPQRGQMPQACEHDSQALASWSSQESYRCGDSWTDDGF